MPNYLERVATAAAATTANARPPASVPLLAVTPRSAMPLEIEEEIVVPMDSPAVAAPFRLAENRIQHDPAVPSSPLPDAPMPSGPARQTISEPSPVPSLP